MMRHYFMRTFVWLLPFVMLACGGQAPPLEVGCVQVDGDGKIVAISFDDHTSIPVTAFTNLAGCERISEIKREELGGNSVRYTRFFRDSAGNRCSVSDQYTKVKEGIVWDVEVRGQGEPWTTGIETTMNYPATASTSCWASWSDCRESEWVDPLLPRPLQDKEFVYGGDSIWDMNTISLPLFSILEKEKDRGLSLFGSPRDTVLDMRLATTVDGRVTFNRSNHKICADQPIRFRMQMVLHNAEWKGGVKQLVDLYPDFFEPKNEKVYEIAGGGAYSSWEGNLDVDKLRKMGFSFNWRAGFDFPYMGLFLPEVNDKNERWERFHQHGVKVGDGYSSVGEMESYMQGMRKQGFHVLCYFNVTEVGNHIMFPPPPRSAVDDKDLWREPNDFVYYTDVKNALVKVDEQMGDAPLYSNWEGCVVVDPAEPSFRNHLIEQARRHIDYLPSNSGLCIDRLDWLRYYNLKGDDSVSWKNNRSSRSMLMSWKKVMSELGPLMHEHDKVIFANVLCSRIDVMEHIDAVYDEYGQLPYSLNRSAFLTLKKPLVAWTVSPEHFKPDADDYFQRHLYLGAFLTIPYPGNDHTILPDPNIEAYYMDYGDLFSMLKGRHWVLSPDAFKIEKGSAKINLFETDACFVMPVVMGDGEMVEVSLDQELSGYTGCKLIYPGGKTSCISPVTKEGRVYFEIPLERKCALLVFDRL